MVIEQNEQHGHNAQIIIVFATPHARYDSLEDSFRNRVDTRTYRVRTRNELDVLWLKSIQPRYIFFPHWSWKIPREVYDRFECVIFHMTDLPFGRGGSPMQNLISRGIYETQLSALRCVEQLDAGPIYLKRPLSLYGTAEEILVRSSKLMEEMIEKIIREQLQPKPQKGEAVVFSRRSLADGDLSGLERLEQVFDFIRMLDGEGYPPAFIETKHLRFEFSRASLRLGEVVADVRITKK